jgi:hypothetical protein
MPKVNLKNPKKKPAKDTISFTEDPIWSASKFGIRGTTKECREAYFKALEGCILSYPTPFRVNVKERNIDAGLFWFKGAYIGSGASSYFDLMFLSMKTNITYTLGCRQRRNVMLDDFDRNNIHFDTYIELIDDKTENYDYPLCEIPVNFFFRTEVSKAWLDSSKVIVDEGTQPQYWDK